MNHDRHQPCPIATTAYWSYRPEYGVPVRITVGRPKRFPHGYLFAPVLAPWELFRPPYRDIDDVEVERRVYRDRLDRHRADITRWFDTFARDYPDQTAVVLCYENVAAGQQCHRRWFAEWAADRLGWSVPEIAQ